MMNISMSQYVSAAVTVMPISDGLGAEICGIDLSHEMDASTFCQVYQAWLQYFVLLFRGQHLTDDDLIRFSKNFGELDWAPVQVLARGK
jgi:taurine dioxygenase